MQQWVDAEQKKIRTCINKMLASTFFASSPRQQRFLDYLVTNTLNGEARRLKGYTIAIDVFDRKDDFDPSLDAIVRVEATRLRNKLREYYDDLGRADDYVIELPKGSYGILITHRVPSADASQITSQRNDSKPLIGITPSLAVLPFTNIGDVAELHYFADGVTDTLISELSRLSGLLVISRHSSFTYRNSTKSDKEIGDELNVTHLLQGCVQKNSERMRVSVQLVSTTNNVPLWSERYDCELKDIFAMQDELARSIAAALQVKLATAEAKRFGHEGTKNIEAHDALLRGIEQHWQYTSKTTTAAQQFFCQAIKLDENYAAAHAWLARSLMLQWIMRFNNDTATAFTQAFTHAKCAVEIDPLLSHAYAVLGWVHYWRKEAAPAITNVKKAVAMDPNNAEAYLFLAQILASSGLGEEALFYIETALRLNPRSSPWCHWVLGQCYWVLKNYDKALESWQTSAQMSATFLPTQYYLCLLHALLGNGKELQIQLDRTKALLADNVAIHSPWLDAKLESQRHELTLIAGLLDSVD